MSSNLPMATAELIDDIEFGHVFRITDNGRLVDGVEKVWAPEYVHHSDESDIDFEGSDWEALTGFTGQYCYHGAVMHPSEYIGRDIANAMIEAPGIYVVCPVTEEEENEYGESASVGWCILRYVK
jgi:hypothetical protein